MIESAISTALASISGLPVYPLLLPNTLQEGVTFQRISDPEMDNGMVRTGLTAGRFQIAFYRIDDYTALVALDRAVWSEWRNIRQGNIAGYPVQYVERGSILQDSVPLTKNHVQYRLVRDYILYFYEDSS